MITVPARESFGRQPSDNWSSPHKDATPMLRHDETLRLKGLECLADGHASDAVTLHKLAFRRQLIARSKPPPRDSVTKNSGNLTVRGSLVRLVNIGQLDQRRPTPLLVWTDSPILSDSAGHGTSERGYGRMVRFRAARGAPTFHLQGPCQR